MLCIDVVATDLRLCVGLSCILVVSQLGVLSLLLRSNTGLSDPSFLILQWNSYKDWFDDSGVTGLHQILVETHKIPGKQAVDFFEYLHQKGYAMFHREPNIQYGGGACIEFSFLQLNPSFFKDNIGNQTVA